MCLSDVLAPSAICVDLEASDATEVIAVLALRLLSLGRVHPSYTEAVIARERVFPTGLPLGDINVAVPHTDVDHVVAPALAVATLRHPALFGSMDDPEERIPVRVVIAMALTDKNAQVDMLQKIAGLIQNQGALEALAAARGPDDVFAALQHIGP